MSKIPVTINPGKTEEKVVPMQPMLGGGAQDSAYQIDFGFLRSLFLRRLGVMSIVFLTIFSLIVLNTFATEKQYTAFAEVVINTRGEARPEVLDVGGELVQGDAEISTELRVLYSRELALGIVDEFDLIHNVHFSPLLINRQSKLQKILGKTPPPRPKPTEEQLEQTRSLVADILRSGLRAARIGNTYSLSISYVHSDRFEAAKMANAFATAYVQDQLTRKQQTSKGNATFLDTRIENLRTQAQEDQEKVQEFRIRNNMLSTAGETLIEQNISALNQQLAQAKAVAAEDDARLRTAQERVREGASGDDVGDVLASGVVQSLRGQRAAISVNVADLKGRYGPDHPELKRAELELADIDRQIQVEINRVISGLQGRANVSRQRVNSLSQSLEVLKDQLAKNNTASVELGDLERRAAGSQALYDSFLNSYKETVAQEGVEKPDARILSEAIVPRGASKPNVILNLLFAIMLGGALAAVTGFVLEMTFTGITSTNEVSQKLGLPALGAIPLNNSVSPRGKTVLKTLTMGAATPLRESLSSLLTTLQFRFNQSGSKVVYVTSALPDEGKTTLVSALGFVSADKGKRTLIIDCDRMRKDLSLSFTKKAQYGLVDIIEGNVKLEQVILKSQWENCDFIMIGNNAENHARIFEGEGFKNILTQLRHKYDLIILDGTPVIPFAESRIVASYADYVLFAVRWRNTKISTIREAVKLLPWHLGDATGVVLTRVNAKLQRRFGVSDILAYSNKYLKYYREAS